MAYQAPFFKLLASDLDQKLSLHHLSRPLLYTKKALFLSISGSPYKRLAIVLDPRFPRIYPLNEEEKTKGIETPFLQSLAKEMHNALVQRVVQFEEDRIIALEMQVNDEAFRPVSRTLVIELLPRANLILLNEDRKVLSSYRPEGLDSPRPLLRGMDYQAPNKPDYIASKTYDGDDLKNYYEECLARHPLLREERRKERYGPLIEKEKRKEKLLLRKLQAFDMDEAKAKEHINDNLIGDALYVGEGLDLEKGILEFKNEIIQFDPHERLSSVAAKFYSRARKAKVALKRVEENRAIAKKELEETQEKIEMLNEADEDLLEEYLPQSQGKTNRKSKANPDKLPYPMSMNHKGVTILFGRSAKENDCLSFMVDTSKEHLWLHVQEGTGAHVMIKKENPNDEEILAAATVALLASNRTDGRVMYTLRKNVKRGKVPGQAIVSTYKSLHVSKIDPEVKSSYRKAKRYQP